MCIVLVYCYFGMLITSCLWGATLIWGRKRITLPQTYCTAVSRSRPEWNACAHQQWQHAISFRPAKLEGFQNMKFTEISQSAFILMNLHFLVIIQYVVNAVLRTQNMCKRVVCLQFIPGYTPDFSAYIAVKISRQHLCFKLVNLYLLYEIRNRVWRDCKE